MALDVWIGTPGILGRHVASFEPEAYYAFLFPLFEEFAQSYGQMIDLYDGALFEPDALVPVLELLDEALALVSSEAETFEVHMGTNLGSYLEPAHEEIYHTVNRSDYLAFIGKLRAGVLEAQRRGRQLVFYGD